ncbi:putative T7SS-secreted protein, partial [Streptomyces zingiberis]
MAGIGDFIPDEVEQWVEDRAEDVGEAIDDAGDWTADRLDDLGWRGGARWVRDTSDSAANALGAGVDELRLGQSEEPKKLIHGSPAKLRSTAAHLTDFRTAFESVGKGLKAVDPSTLKGEAAEAFAGKLAGEPKRWFTAADACEKAAEALEDFAVTVEWAQGQAELAIEKYRRGQRLTAEARTAHAGRIDAYNAAVEAYNAGPAERRDPASLPEKPGAFTDPGATEREAAEELLAEARRQRDTARRAAATSVGAARDEAPAAPSYAEQVQDGVVGMRLNSSHFLGGVLKGTAGLLDFAHAVNPVHPYNATHPAEYVTNLNSTTAGLLRTVNDPGAAVTSMWNDFSRDPAEGTGRLLPELLGTRGLGSAKKGLSAAREGAKPGRSLLDRDGHREHSTPDCDKTCKGTDPVDLATGRMFLPQTDVALPGALPLVFTRRAESGYTAGRWFGPSWSSTADQRLEIDAEGVVLVAEDGLLPAYPHPAPGEPVLPAAGPRRPLARTPEGDYTVTDPATGLVRHFTGPEGVPPGGDGEARLAEITDRNGHSLTFEYTEDGAPAAIAHGAGPRLRFTTAEGRITALHLAGAAEDGTDLELVRYGYTDGDLTEVTGSSGLPLRFAYDADHRVTAWTDTNDRRYDYVYDDRHRCVAEGGTEGHLALRIAYTDPDPATGHRTTTVTTAQGHTTRYLIDARRNILAETDPTGAVTRTTYDERDRVASRTDPLGHTTAFHHDEAGHLTAVHHPDGTTSTATYNDLGLPTTVTHPGGATWQQTYDASGNRLTLTDPSGATTHYSYDGRGHPTAVTDALGHTTTLHCDEAGRLRTVTDPLGGATRYERDAFGRVVSVMDPVGGVTRLVWSVEGKLLRRTGPDGAEESWAYDGEGNCTAYTDAMGAVTEYEYTHFDLLSAQRGPDGARYTFDHGPDLLLRTVTNPQGLTWTYDYDAAGRLRSETDFDGRTLTYTYDPAGRLASRTNALGQTIRFTHDALGRITSKDAAGAVTHYTYDRAGRLIETSNPDATVLLRRDRLGR